MSMRRALLVALACVAAAPALAQSARITIPAVASFVGAVPFYSDVRVFNTSYTASIEVVATYRCFILGCPPTPVQETFVLQPRESRAFDNMVEVTFGAPNSAGAVEFDLGSGVGVSDVAITSRLYSTSPQPTVGMFVPGKTAADAHRYSVLTQIANTDAGQGFRTNIGAFNGQDTTAQAVFTLYYQGHYVGEVAHTLPPHAGLQINDIFGANGVSHPLLETTDSVVTVKTDGPAIFTYAAVIDGRTTDPIYVSGAADVPPVLSVGGTNLTRVTLGQNTCGNVTVQDNPTTVVQTPGSHTLTLTHAGITYEGTVEDDGSFTMQPEAVGGFTITIQGQFHGQGFIATVRVEQASPACFYLVEWDGFRETGANYFP